MTKSNQSEERSEGAVSHREETVMDTCTPTKRIVRCIHTFVGPWHRATAPNGSVSCTERNRHTVEIFEADYYGKGPKLYASGYHAVQVDYGSSGMRTGPRHNDWQDGHPDRVDAWIERIKADGGEMS